MIRLTQISHNGMRMLKQKSQREHKKAHLAEANRIRGMAKTLYDAGVINEDDYNDAKLAAIAEENRECMGH